MNHKFTMEFKNVYLRPLEEQDIERLRNWRNNPENNHYLSTIPYITPQMQNEWYQKYLRNEDELCFSIIETCELHRMVGSLSLYHFSSDSCFLGKLMVGDKEAHGRSVGLNSILAVCKIASVFFKKKTIMLTVYSENTKAINVYNNSGFIIIDEHKTTNGKTEYTMIKKLGVD